MTGVKDQLNAFLDYPDVEIGHAVDGPLAGLTLGVKDIFDVAGYRTGGGNPEKLAESPVAPRTAPAIQALLDAGARFAGKTQTEELTYSMIGINAHFPSPVNTRAPQRVTGGSSSGSVAAVAGGLVDIAAGSDTNGSIRAPASFCGLLGLRTTQGRITLEGTMPLAPSCDTFGWFAKDAPTYARVGSVLLGEDPHKNELRQPMRAAELEVYLFGAAERDAYSAMLGKIEAHFGRQAGFLAFPGDPAELFARFKEVQGYEAWQVHGPFLSAAKRKLGPGVRERFDAASRLTDSQYESAKARRREFAQEFSGLFDGDMVLVLPTQPSAAPLKDSNPEELERYRDRALTLTAIAGLLGMPQITIPLGTVHDAPFGISLLGPQGSDRQLIAIAAAILEKNGQ